MARPYTPKAVKPLAWVRDGDCIRCTSHACDTFGRPIFVRGGRFIRIARHIMFRKFGVQSREIVTRHTCDHPWCIRPDHILKGTRADNSRDMVERGRNRDAAERCSKVTAAQVVEIRAATGKLSDIAMCFGITAHHVWQIRTGRRRVNVPKDAVKAPNNADRETIAALLLAGK